METFIEPKNLVSNPQFQIQKQRSIQSLNNDMIEAPLVNLVDGLNKLPCSFTLQCCYGHFVYKGQGDIHNLEPLPFTDSLTEVTYRIAYICFCIEKSFAGMELLKALKKITALSPENIQFCSAAWFWDRQVNTYVLQVEPDRFKHQDQAKLGYKEALKIEKTRNDFFVHLRKICVNHKENIL